jgi:peptide/nickel transport system substrate-binding protein
MIANEVKQLAIIGPILGLLLISSIFASAMAIDLPNPPARPMQFIEDTGGTPATVDPAIAYDTASGEMIFNVYDTLITFNAEQLGQYLGVIADSWVGQNITGTTGPYGIQYYYRYTFHLRNWANITFASTSAGANNTGGINYTLSAADVQYSFWREMILDAPGGPQWMLYEPLLNNAGGAAAMGNLSDNNDIRKIGYQIENSVEQNGTHVWFNIAFPGSYGPFLQILAQTWGSIMSKQWINTFVIGVKGQNDWSGDWMANAGNHTDWINQHGVYESFGPLDIAGHLMYGTGPFILTEFNTALKFWTMTRNTGYFRGWPATFPKMASVGPAGYVNNVKNYFGKTWAARKADFLAGDCDFVAVPRANLAEVYTSTTPPFNPPTNYPKDGIRCTPNLPTLSMEGMFFTFDIDPTTFYGPINAPGNFTSDGIPSDFFGNPVWGLHVRKGFAYALDYATYIAQAFLGEGTHVYTALIPGIPYYDPSVIGYDYNLALAKAEFDQVPGIVQNGFNIKVLWNVPNLARETCANVLKAGLASINATYVVVSTGVDWDTLLAAGLQHQAPVFNIGWLADYPDAHNFALPFYHSAGTYPIYQAYSNSTLTALVNQGIATADGPARQTIYTNLAKAVIQDCPSVALAIVKGRIFERDWNEGRYYNSIYPGIFFYNLWKWYYVPQVTQNAPGVPTQPKSDQLPADVNYDGRVNMIDIGTVAFSFGALAGPPIDLTWVFRCDTNLDRKVDMKDIGYVASNFNVSRITDKWVPT